MADFQKSLQQKDSELESVRAKVTTLNYKCMNGDVGMGWTMRNIMETRKSLSNAIKDTNTSTIMRNPLPEYVGRGYALLTLGAHAQRGLR